MKLEVSPTLEEPWTRSRAACLVAGRVGITVLNEEQKSDSSFSVRCASEHTVCIYLSGCVRVAFSIGAVLLR